jgi:hypothetical protein
MANDSVTSKNTPQSNQPSAFAEQKADELLRNVTPDALGNNIKAMAGNVPLVGFVPTDVRNKAIDQALVQTNAGNWFDKAKEFFKPMVATVLTIVEPIVKPVLDMVEKGKQMVISALPEPLRKMMGVADSPAAHLDNVTNPTTPNTTVKPVKTPAATEPLTPPLTPKVVNASPNNQRTHT